MQANEIATSETAVVMFKIALEALKVITQERLAMSEIVFLVEDDPDSGYSARALGESIFTQAEDMESLREMVRDAVYCHFPDQQNCPKVIRFRSC